MNQIATSPKLLAGSRDVAAHIIADRPTALRQILTPGVNLGLWRRSPESGISKELSPLGPSHLPDVRCSTSRVTFDEDVKILLIQQDLAPAAFKRWRADLRKLANLFFSLSEGREVILRLETTDTDGCRRFHVDRTHLRLLCTYRGPGTEWLTNEQVDRDAQGSGAPNERIIRFGEPSRFEPFWVGIMKGSAFPGNASRGLMHRSPPITGSGQTRLLFCLDC